VVRSGGIASGVVVAFNGTERTLELGNDGGNIILSAGALGSPRLLMKSGIGEGSALADLSAAGLLDMPSGEWINNTAVGDKLFDNPNTFIELSGDAVDSFTYKYSDPAVQDEDLYLQSRSGPYASAGQTDVVFDKITLANGETYGVQGTFGSAGYQDFTSNHTITMNVYGTSGMASTGRVLLDDQGVPRPSSFLYSDPRDADAIATFIRKLFDALPQSTLTPQNIAPNATHEELVRYITTPSSYATGYVNHFAGSCRLGACVDLDARVKGVQNLFVVDASITAPFSVNPMFGIMAAAERASELILNGYEKV
jgi:cellobiose dehydrogenase (acceptor)